MNHIEIALKEYGQKEIAGDIDNPRIVQYSTDIGNTYVKDDEVPWCSEFVNWCLLQTGIKGTKSAVAKSFLKWGEELKEPEFGCIVIFGWDDGSGHIGFYINEAPGGIRVLGGNQNDEVNIKVYKKDKVLSYRRVPSPSADEKTRAIYLSIIEILNKVLALYKSK